MALWFRSYTPINLRTKGDLKEIKIKNQFKEYLEINTTLTTRNSKTENCNSYQIIKWDSYSLWK